MCAYPFAPPPPSARPTVSPATALASRSTAWLLQGASSGSLSIACTPPGMTWTARHCEPREARAFLTSPTVEADLPSLIRTMLVWRSSRSGDAARAGVTLPALDSLTSTSVASAWCRAGWAAKSSGPTYAKTYLAPSRSWSSAAVTGASMREASALSNATTWSSAPDPNDSSATPQVSAPSTALGRERIDGAVATDSFARPDRSKRATGCRVCFATDSVR